MARKKQAKPLTLTTRRKLAAQAVKSGNWIIRFGPSPDGSQPACYKGFAWAPLGEWTEAPDWNERAECGGGLHGQCAEAGGHRHDSGPHLLFCESDGPRVVIGDNKCKVRKARVLLVDELPRDLTVGGGLSLNGCTALTSLGDLTVGGWLTFYCCPASVVKLVESRRVK